MIFLTVGSELPFDRLTKAVDKWAELNTEYSVFGQIGKISDKDEAPSSIKYCQVLNPEEYMDYIKNCSLIIAHAGMGSIITALTEGKPIVIMPRREKYRETRNDHQVGTAEKFSTRESIFWATDEHDLRKMIDEALNYIQRDVEKPEISAFAPEEMLNKLRDFITA